MTKYAWKISSSERVYAENIGSLTALETCLHVLDLPMDRPPSEIISFMKLMQLEGQAVYKYRSKKDAGSQWTLVWIELPQ